MLFGDTKFADYAVKNLMTILDKTKAKIVLSSTWRIVPDWKYDIIQAGGNCFIDSIVGITPDLMTDTDYGFDQSRDSEILSYINDHPEIDKYICIDDMHLKNLFAIRTKPRIGIDNKIMTKAIMMLL